VPRAEGSEVRRTVSVPDLVAIACWALAIALFVVAAIVGPEGECDIQNHDSYVAAGEQAGYALAVAALAILISASLLLGGALGRRGPGRIVRAVAGLISLPAAGLTGFFALLLYASCAFD
jgi:hypothetical protein